MVNPRIINHVKLLKLLFVFAMIRKEDDNEQILLDLIKNNDHQAMHTLYCRYVRYLSAICSRYISLEDDIKDVLQDSFLKIFSSISSFNYRGSGSVKGWMAKIVLNETLKFVKRNYHFNFTELSNEELDIPDEMPSSENIPLPVIHQFIRELPDGYRAIFNLYVIEEKSHKEIAKLLGIKESTSASQLHRAKALLAKKIKNYLKPKYISI